VISWPEEFSGEISRHCSNYYVKDMARHSVPSFFYILFLQYGFSTQQKKYYFIRKMVKYASELLKIEQLCPPFVFGYKIVLDVESVSGEGQK